MKIDIITVGKLKEKYLVAACQEYMKRLTPYAKVTVKEVTEEKSQEPIHEKEIEIILKKEGDRLLQHLSPQAYIIVLAIEGKALSSPAFAEKLNHLTTYEKSHIQFVIGGSYGLDPQIIKKADFLLSFSKMTFPHQLIRVFLLEQIYRACKINRGETYHK